MPLLDQLASLLGPSGLLTGSDMTGFESDWRGLYHGRAAAVLRPADTAQVAQAVRLCAAAGASIVPQGGNTSMVGGAAPDESGAQFVLSLSRMNRVRELDRADMSITLEAGMTLKAGQEAAEAAGLMLPLSINAEGSATIGGVLATNAGGNLTVRYGNARDLVLGLEVVLADGSVFEGLRRLRKDNTGYCLRQLFVGSEGTLGIITAAVLKLAPRPRQREVALCALPTAEAALALFGRFQQHDPGAVQAFEYMSGTGMALVNALIPGATLPLAEPAAHYVLVELATPREGGDLRAGLESVLEAAIEAEEVLDAVLAESEAQRLGLWMLREEHSEAQKRAGASVKNDVSVPVSRIPAFLEEATRVCEAMVPGIRVAPFGHIGDGNIHFNLVQPEGADPAGFLARDHALMDAVGAVVQRLDGSFSAEHGVGRLKPYMMPLWRGGAELEAMRAIKAALDPQHLLNPLVMLPRP
ncbi:FAD/FMN-containing dehydrogenase [Endobacter medicaginis]|jgi:FAD/FMN-containing dehydrogenase|uniref:FAD-binding oxidoreductase n=1 Tax=Endobacter medicaginis TaxID=1181271 RepID=A0A850NVB8_9PROT|nr:FAD-binding oxidoreductase [Endobacter medicaginis]MBB3174217.1 FAD/FMN-containing dehydrogenase [Endobacter medicaginis]MCX5474261.1 FAD-binding oxidoreductase [Endobacter medicaginis]NVN31445.1 FAD-binding oxidoreductase [Endobacter medicaginis]